MAKGEAKKNNQMMDTEYRRAGAESDQYNQMVRDRLPGASDRANDQYHKIDSGYDDLMGGFGDYYRRGGFDPEMRSQLQGDMNSFRNFAKTGGVDAAGRARMRGGGVYDEFSKTGGLSDTDRTNMRSRSNSAIPAFYSSLKDELGQQNAASGGYSPGYSAGLAKMARDQGHASVDAARDTELGITDAVNKGRMWGAEGMTSSEGALQDLLSRNTLAGLGGASGIGLELGKSDDQAKQFALGGMGNVLQGRQNLYSSAPGEYEDLLKILLAGQGQGSDQRSRTIGQRVQNNPNVSTWDRIMQGVNGAAGMGSTLLSGGWGGGNAGHSLGGQMFHS